jgi:hypothetical protein
MDTEKTKKETQPRILSDSKIENLRNYADQIRQIVNKAKEETGIDLNDTDNLKKIDVEDLVRKYDPDYRSSWRRHGIDAISKDEKIEGKNTGIKNAERPLQSGPNKGGERTGSWTFHARTNDHYDRFVGVVRDRMTSRICRVYDIKTSENIKKIKQDLTMKSEEWEKSNAVNDRIFLDENFVKSFDGITENAIDGVIVRRDW